MSQAMDEQGVDAGLATRLAESFFAPLTGCATKAVEAVSPVSISLVQSRRFNRAGQRA
jgi:hypothetical protein